jgi:hypothetical protein
MTTNSLIDKLRRRIKDDRPNVKAMSLSVSDDKADRAIAEVTNGHLIVKVGGGSAPSVDMRLDDSRYATVGRLHQALARMNGYTVSLDEDAQEDHMSLDIYPVAPTDVGAGRSSIELKHHLFSDSELDEVMEQAIQRHNPRFNAATLPEAEEAFVMMLAHADICRRQAYDSAKRRGLDTTAQDLLMLADSIERSHAKDVERLSRALVSPGEPVPSTMGTGDVVVGTAFRSSLRTGRRSPFAAQPGPVAPVFVEPEPEDVEDELARIQWSRSGDNDFHSFELWMDTVPEVSGAVQDQLAVRPGSPMFYHYEGVRQGSSQRVMQVYGASIVGQGARTYTVSELEPDVEYFFRLVVKDGNGGVASSEVMSVRTKPLRTRFQPDYFASVLWGIPGTAVTLFFNPDKGPLTENHLLRFGDYSVEFAVVDDYTATLIVPDFVNKRIPKNLVIESPSGLRDVSPQSFQVM